jgi:nucleoside-diphosphate-sugar epimerase
MEPNIKVLVTGASGQIGSRLARKLVQHGADVYALSSINSFENEPRIKYIRKNWGESFVEEIPEIELVFHLASQTSAYIARASVSKDIQTNLLDTIHLIERLSHQARPPALIYAGSMTEYGMGQARAINEKYEIDPQTFYDVGKIASEMYLEQYVREGLLRSCITLRLANIYGAKQVLNGNGRGFLDRSIKNAIEGKNIEMFGDGNYLRDYLYIEDAVKAFYSAGKIASKVDIEVFNIGTGQGTLLKTALQQIVDGANKLTGKKSRIVEIEYPATAYNIEKRDSISDPSSFMAQTGWVPSIELREGVRRCLMQALSPLDEDIK